jgi:gas vesicle protein
MKKFWIGLAVGALAGGVAALFFAPQSGASTRRKVRRSLEDLGDSLNDAADYVKQQADRLTKEAQKVIDGGKSQFGDVLDAAQEYAKTTGAKLSDQSSRLM